MNNKSKKNIRPEPVHNDPVVPDELAQLRAENARLKGQVAAAGSMGGPMTKLEKAMLNRVCPENLKRQLEGSGHTPEAQERIYKKVRS